MNLQNSCHVIEKLLEEDAKVAEGKLTWTEFTAINNIMLEMQLSGKHTPKDSYSKEGDAK